MKQLLKRFLFGDDTRPFRIRAGLLRGCTFLIDPLHQSQRLAGLSEREISSVLRTFTRQARSAVDVGASDGWYTLYFAAQPSISRVFACEPNKASAYILRKNLALNPQVAANKVSIIPNAIGAVSGADVVALDALLGAALEPILVKIDVDGGELECLTGFGVTLRQKDVMLIVETHSVQLEEQCLKFCIALGYRCRVIRNAWYRRFLPELRPIQHNRWFVAQKPPK